MSQNVLTDSQELLIIQTLRWLTQLELGGAMKQRIRNEFEAKIKLRYGDHLDPPENWVKRI